MARSGAGGEPDGEGEKTEEEEIDGVGVEMDGVGVEIDGVGAEEEGREGVFGRLVDGR